MMTCDMHDSDDECEQHDCVIDADCCCPTPTIVRTMEWTHPATTDVFTLSIGHNDDDEWFVRTITNHDRIVFHYSFPTRTDAWHQWRNEIIRMATDDWTVKLVTTP